MSVIPNGRHVTRAEFETHLKSIDSRLAKIERLLDTKPAWYWALGRWTNVIDKLAPAALAAAAAYIVTRLF